MKLVANAEHRINSNDIPTTGETHSNAESSASRSLSVGLPTTLGGLFILFVSIPVAEMFINF